MLDPDRCIAGPPKLARLDMHDAAYPIAHFVESVRIGPLERERPIRTIDRDLVFVSVLVEFTKLLRSKRAVGKIRHLGGTVATLVIGVHPLMIEAAARCIDVDFHDVATAVVEHDFAPTCIAVSALSRQSMPLSPRSVLVVVG